LLNFIGYVETVPGSPRTSETEMKMLCGEVQKSGAPISSSILARHDDVWNAIRKFFIEHSEA
ncbi:MAG TPA: DUF444 domain-containing protein, partial [Noviherbaspirillum sp.]